MLWSYSDIDSTNIPYIAFTVQSQHWPYELHGSPHFLHALRPRDDTFPTHKHQHNTLRILNAINQAWKQLRLIRAALFMLCSHRLKPDREASVDGGDEVDDSEGGGRSERVLDALQYASVELTGVDCGRDGATACTDQFARAEDQRCALRFPESHDTRSKALGVVFCVSCAHRDCFGVDRNPKVDAAHEILYLGDDDDDWSRLWDEGSGWLHALQDRAGGGRRRRG